MSLILEALRKSEAERRRGEGPDLLRSELPLLPAAPSGIRAWHWLLPLLLALPLLWWWQRAIVAPAAAPAVAIAPTTSNTPAGTPPSIREPALPPVAHLQPPPPAPAGRAPPAPSASPALAAAPPDPVVLGALPSGERKALPPLQLSMHLWNEDQARRLAILDGKRVVAGDRIGEAVVVEIRRDGVLLDWHGERILVPLR